MIGYTKLKSGEWGVRLKGEPDVRAGQSVSVTTKAGKVKTETIKCVVWSGDGLQLCAIEQREMCANCEERVATTKAHDLSGILGPACARCANEGSMSFM